MKQKGTREAEEEDAAEEEDDGLGTPGPLKIITTALDGIVGILFLIPKNDIFDMFAHRGTNNKFSCR